MASKKTKLTPLEVRKQLLVLESELNRRLLVEAVDDWHEEVHRTKQHLLTLGSTVSTVAKVGATISIVRRLFARRNGHAKSSWLGGLFRGVTTGMSVWKFVRSHLQPAAEEAED